MHVLPTSDHFHLCQDTLLGQFFHSAKNPGVCVCGGGDCVLMFGAIQGHLVPLQGNHTASSDVQQTTVYDYSNESPPHTCGSKTLVFESRFESGNLYKATQVWVFTYS